MKCLVCVTAHQHHVLIRKKRTDRIVLVSVQQLFVLLHRPSISLLAYVNVQQHQPVLLPRLFSMQQLARVNVLRQPVQLRRLF